MFNRAERFPTVPDHIPGPYNLSTPYDTKACRVPFNCSAPAHALADNHVPAPCTYNLRFRKRRIQGGASLRFTEPRITLQTIVSPSPLSYDPDFVYKRPPKATIKGKICRGKPPRYGLVSPISVPYKLFNGFNIKGNYLVKRPPPEEYTKRVEPIYYSFPFEVNKTTLKYKGNFWSKLTSVRKPLLAGDFSSPGICTYDLLDKPPTEFQKYLDKIRFHYRATMKSLRTLDIWQMRLLRLDEPGPGSYDIPDGFVRKEPIKGTFSRAPRCTMTEEEEEGDYKEFLNLRKPLQPDSHQKMWPPFNTSDKSQPEEKYTGPRPTDYLVWDHTIAYKLAKDLQFSRVVYPFNSSVARVCDFGNMSSSNPGPCDYEIDRFPYKPKVFIFGKKDELSYEPPLKLIPIWKLYENEVAPWSYEVNSSFYKLSGRRDVHKGEVWRRDKRDRLKWLEVNRSTDAMYTHVEEWVSDKGQLKFCGRPVPKEIEDSPGPADYNIHPLYREGLARALFTFNVSRLERKTARKWKTEKRPEDLGKYRKELSWPHSLIFDLINFS